MGKIELDHTGSGSGVTLSSDGTDLLLDGAAIGGGGAALELYAENPSSATAPTTAGANDIAIGSGADTLLTSTDKLAIGTSTTAQGNYATAVGAYARADGNNSSAAFGYATDAGGQGALALGYLASAQGSQATAINYSYASGASSFAAAITNNTASYGATGANSVAIGYQAKATQSYAFAVGYQAQATNNTSISMGFQSVSSGSQSIALGYKGQATGIKSFGVHNNTNGGATGTNSVAIGDSCLASSVNSIAIGQNAKADANTSVAIGKYVDTKGIFGKFVFSAASLSGNADGSSQSGKQVLMCDTTDATAEALNAHNGTASATNQVILPNNSAYFFSGTCVARESATDGTDMGAWEFKGCIRREANAGTTTLVSSTIDEFSAPTGWSIALSADTTNGGLAVTVTGAASTNIRWVATVHTSEVTYA